MKDMVEAGNSRRILTDAQEDEICDRSNGHKRPPVQTLSAEFGVSRAVIYRSIKKSKGRRELCDDRASI